ncbi:tRNA-specific 2-thiouridylase [Cuneatibacter caecimuris]|uniref:tRNA-specific 2-thiouridylase MnmA n=1 Tax=Cuneatibacter caecimuris TaxID=1796618 RepID=A0A4Q7PJV2_9FIRM|nr:tRNA-specific 2-thiouridylase [Cuneatibacter caecimuris]
MRQTVIIGLSGGVDSSAAAFLLKEQGYSVIGVTMRLWPESSEEAGLAAIEDARQVADTLNIPFHVLDFRSEFESDVITYFMDEYRNGRTPNPCVICNRRVKWTGLLQAADRLGADFVATGHYARVRKLDNGRFAVCRSATDSKDQTYALYNLTQEQLSRTLMPAGEYEKEQIREIAQSIGLHVAGKKDSQEICFIPDQDYNRYLEEHSPSPLPPQGNFVTAGGDVLGTHRGITHYTIGQRKGLNLAMGRPVFVTALRPDTNEVVIGESEDLFTKKLVIRQVNFQALSSLAEPVRASGKIRYAHRGAPCILTQTGPDEVEAVFEEPQRAITPGQAAVFYQRDAILCGGLIV